MITCSIVVKFRKVTWLFLEQVQLDSDRSVQWHLFVPTVARAMCVASLYCFIFWVEFAILALF